MPVFETEDKLLSLEELATGRRGLEGKGAGKL
jgi:hypothetical protein